MQSHMSDRLSCPRPKNTSSIKEMSLQYTNKQLILIKDYDLLPDGVVTESTNRFILTRQILEPLLTNGKKTNLQLTFLFTGGN